MFNIGRFQQNLSSRLSFRILPGIVVDVDDPQRLQRVRVRIPNIHQGLKDDELPWVGSLVNTFSAAAASTLGAVQVPQKGARVWTMYLDDSGYHGVYLGAVPRRNTRVTELVGKPNDTDPFTGANAGKPVTPADQSDQPEYAKDYPHVVGSIDQSGNLLAVNTKRDTIEYTHVSGTSFQVDGKGNVQIAINNYNNPNNDARTKFGNGLTVLIVGDAKVVATQNLILQAGQKLLIDVLDEIVVKTKKFTIHAKEFIKVLSNSALVRPDWEPTTEQPQDPNVSPVNLSSRSRPTVPDPSNQTDQ